LPSYPPLPEELVEFTRGGRSLLVGTASNARVPDCVRALGLRVWEGASQLTVIVPVATSAASIANLRENPRIAITCSQIQTHRTIQLKGDVLAIREGSEQDRAFAIAYRAQFAQDLAWAGQSSTNTLRLNLWPCFAIDVEIRVAFAQTPGPDAGLQLPQAKF
jgi:hypothetical protein